MAAQTSDLPLAPIRPTGVRLISQTHAPFVTHLPRGVRSPLVPVVALTSELYFARYDACAEPRIVSWVRNDTELKFLAPGTPPPLTVEKVAAWGRDRANRLLLRQSNGDPLVGYAELNDMPRRSDQMWIGHLIVNPEFRGRGIGLRLTQALLARAFIECGAAEVLLLVFPENRAAVSCYEKCGMVVAGQEHKSFPATGARHRFLRMSVRADRYHRLVDEGKLIGRPLPVRR